LVSKVWDIYSGFGPCFGWWIVQILRQRRRKTTNIAPTTLSAIQASSQFTFINPLVISRNDKNKQLTLISQRKLALTAINILFALENDRRP
jgi:hypothetical protein